MAYPVSNKKYNVAKPNALSYDSDSSWLSDIGGFLGSVPGLGAVGGILSVLSGIFGSKDSPQDEASKAILARLEREMANLATPSYTQGQVEGKVSGMQDTVRGAANVAATATGTALSESLGAGGTPSGQPKGEIYTAALAPVIAQGERDAASVEQWGMQFWASLDDAAKQRLLAGLGLEASVATGLPGMTQDQKGIATFLQTLNLLTTGFGNVAQGYTDITHKNIKV